VLPSELDEFYDFEFDEEPALTQSMDNPSPSDFDQLDLPTSSSILSGPPPVNSIAVSEAIFYGAMRHSLSLATTGETYDLDFELGPEQQAVYDAAMRGQNLFFTGVAGTGKSLVIRRIIRGLREKYGPAKVWPEIDPVAITALTGIAATNIGGMTVHRWAGVSLGQDLHEIEAAHGKKEFWKGTEVLLIDEISMMCSKFFQRLETKAREIRHDEQPFGGIQVRPVCRQQR
jgi:hypothetical protein